jgi:hypothetical protein
MAPPAKKPWAAASELAAPEDSDASTAVCSSSFAKDTVSSLMDVDHISAAAYDETIKALEAELDLERKRCTQAAQGGMMLLRENEQLKRQLQLEQGDSNLLRANEALKVHLHTLQREVDDLYSENVRLQREKDSLWGDSSAGSSPSTNRFVAAQGTADSEGSEHEDTPPDWAQSKNKAGESRIRKSLVRERAAKEELMDSNAHLEQENDRLRRNW